MCQEGEKLMLSAEQKTLFEEDGIIKLPDFLPMAVVEPAVKSAFEVFAEAGIWAENQWLLDHLPPTNQPAAGSDLVKGTKNLRATRNLVTPGVLELMKALSNGEELNQFNDKMQLLFTRPNATSWTVPATIWHLDTPRLPSGSRPGVQMFTFLNQVEPSGGGTLVVAGSHRLLNDNTFIRSKDVKKRLKTKPFFKDLLNKHCPDREQLMARREVVEDIPLRIVEMTGQPGDIYLTDLRILHTLANNALKVPRVMATQRFFTETGWSEMMEGHAKSRAAAETPRD